MKEKKTTPAAKKETLRLAPLFEKNNFRWMLIGAVLMAAGFILMAGGRSEDPNIFNADEIYGFRRITLAPILILAGLVVEIYAIFSQPKKDQP